MNFSLKRTQLILLFVVLGITVHAQVQTDPATWAYGLKKIKNASYEIHLRCSLEKDWHIYAQQQTPDFIGTKTKIQFDKQPGLVLIGTPKELGTKIKYELKDVGITNYEYSGAVDFVQRVTLSPAIKEISGSVTYQTCTHERCLQEKTVKFKIPVNTLK